MRSQATEADRSEEMCVRGWHSCPGGAAEQSSRLAPPSRLALRRLQPLLGEARLLLPLVLSLALVGPGERFRGGLIAAAVIVGAGLAGGHRLLAGVSALDVHRRLFGAQRLAFDLLAVLRPVFVALLVLPVVGAVVDVVAVSVGAFRVVHFLLPPGFPFCN